MLMLKSISSGRIKNSLGAWSPEIIVQTDRATIAIRVGTNFTRNTFERILAQQGGMHAAAAADYVKQ